MNSKLFRTILILSILVSISMVQVHAATSISAPGTLNLYFFVQNSTCWNDCSYSLSYRTYLHNTVFTFPVNPFDRIYIESMGGGNFISAGASDNEQQVIDASFSNYINSQSGLIISPYDFFNDGTFIGTELYFRIFGKTSIFDANMTLYIHKTPLAIHSLSAPGSITFISDFGVHRYDIQGLLGKTTIDSGQSLTITVSRDSYYNPITWILVNNNYNTVIFSSSGVGTETYTNLLDEDIEVSLYIYQNDLLSSFAPYRIDAVISESGQKIGVSTEKITVTETVTEYSGEITKTMTKTVEGTFFEIEQTTITDTFWVTNTYNKSEASFSPILFSMIGVLYIAVIIRRYKTR